MSLKEQKIIKLTEREHILKRAGMYLGSSTITKSQEYIIESSDVDYFKLTEVAYVPGLVKIFNELIDNSIDEFVRTKGQFATKIDVTIDEQEFSVKDNGRGIPVKLVHTPEGDLYQPELAWTHARAGSNFEDEESATIGTNGVGSMIASVFSTKFVGVSNDGENKCTVTCTDNNTTINTKIGKPTGSKGVTVHINPDVKRFGLAKITQEHIDMIKQRLYNLSVSYPEITFKLNGSRIKLKAKEFLKMFGVPGTMGSEGTIIETDKFSIGVFPSDTDDFKQFSLMNGLNLSAGGTHVDYISSTIVKIVREKVAKKYNSIKPADVKRKLFIVCIMKDFKGPKYETQTKEKLTNPAKDITKYFEDLDLDKLSERVYKNKAITDSIIDYFKIAEEYKKKKDLKGLDKVKKKIKSEKYTKPVGNPEVLMICEGKSASSALLPGMGRKGIGYYELKGKPLNAYSSSQAKFTANKELTELYQIIKQVGYTKFCIAADADLDGIAIVGLMTAFAKTYLPDELAGDMFYMLRTPVGASKKNKKIHKWVYNIHDMDSLNENGCTVTYYKGLGSWKPDDMKVVIAAEGLSKMLVPLTYTEADDVAIDDWYSDKKADKRKEFIQANEFSLMKL
jgi:DNA topoisomerase-2